MQRTVLASSVVAALSCLTLAASASEEVQPAGAGAPTLSAEERIRRATVPPPGKDCAQEPQDAALVKLDKEHAENLAFVTMSEAMISSAMKTSEREWGATREALVTASKKDWSAWRERKEQEGMTWTALPPCPEPGRENTPKKHRGRKGFERGITSLVGMVIGSRRDRHARQRACAPGDTRCEAASKRESQPVRDADGNVMHCQPRETPGLKLFSKVRAELVAGRRGTNLLIASASNVPVECAVEVSVRRGADAPARQMLAFQGPGSRGGIVKEIAMGFSQDAYGDQLTLNTACVPRFVWSRSRSSSQKSRP